MMDDMTTMTMNDVLETIRVLSPEERGRVASELEAIAIEQDDVYVPTPEQRADIERGMADFKAGRFITEEEFRRTVLKRA